MFYGNAKKKVLEKVSQAEYVKVGWNVLKQKKQTHISPPPLHHVVSGVNRSTGSNMMDSWSSQSLFDINTVCARQQYSRYRDACVHIRFKRFANLSPDYLNDQLEFD